MHPRFLRRRPRFSYTTAADAPDKRLRSMTLLLFLAALLLFLAGAAVFLKDISCQIAVSDARDIVTVQVNEAIARIMAEGDYAEDSFVSFEKNAAGEITAISANMARINALSAEILHEVVDATENRTLRVSIPLGNLTGVSLLMGRGPGVPVQIIMLTSSRVEFQNNIITAGINQTKHQIDLQVLVDIDILIPWGTESAQVVTDVMIADTVVVGKVPESYWSMQQ
ncbi:MAG: sporulation protein YunB [Oscillospiraceae bacterium]|nr:sporulation protein YunB [Oscillospiraceae bacterium]